MVFAEAEVGAVTDVTVKTAVLALDSSATGAVDVMGALDVIGALDVMGALEAEALAVDNVVTPVIHAVEDLEADVIHAVEDLEADMIHAVEDLETDIIHVMVDTVRGNLAIELLDYDNYK